jgi:phospho-N-acetylmuramoyl-pentapeptide-transferase
MLYELFSWLKQHYNIIGSGLFQYLTFRAAMAILLSLIMTTVYGKKLIQFLKNKQLGETVRDLGLAGEQQKKGTPTMGGIIILLAIIIPTLLFADLNKEYNRLMMLCTVWLGIIGFLDDYFKIKARKLATHRGEQYKKKDSDGLAGVSKIIGQVGLGIIIGATLYFNSNVTVESEVITKEVNKSLHPGEIVAKGSNVVTRNIEGENRKFVEGKTPITTIPFTKNHEFNYNKLISWIGEGADR